MARLAVMFVVLAGCRLHFDPIDAIDDAGCSPRLDCELIAYWRFDEGVGINAVDAVEGQVAVLENGATWAPGRSGTALELDGVSDDAIANSDKLDNLRAFTFAAWIRPRTSGEAGRGVIVAKGGTGAAASRRFIINGATCAACLEVVVNGYGYVYTDPTTIAFQTWQHVAATFDPAAGFHVYRDGVEVADSDRLTFPDPVPEDDSATGFVIGGWPTDNVNGVFDGAIDELRIYGRALPATEIDDLARLP